MAATRRVNVTFSYTVAASESGDSFLNLLCRRFPYHTQDEWIERVLTGHVLLDGTLTKPDFIIKRGMQLEYHVENYEEPGVPIDFHEIGARGDLALVHKPAGLPVHKTGKIFVHTLARLYRESRNDESWAPLNRLDVETSGIVAFGRGPESLRRFSPVEPGTRWKKIYLAVVQGELKTGGRVEFPLAEKPGDLLRSRMHPDPLGKKAKTLFQPLQVQSGKTLLLIRALTGRKHQIRAHLSALGFPIVGDKTYGHDGRYYLKRLESELNEEDLKMLGSPHHLLHALHLEIRAEDGTGLQGTDFDLPEAFLKKFPGFSSQFSSITTSKAFRLLSDEIRID